MAKTPNCACFPLSHCPQVPVKLNHPPLHTSAFSARVSLFGSHTTPPSSEFFTSTSRVLGNHASLCGASADAPLS